MRYTISTNDNGGIIAINRWKPIIETIFDNNGNPIGHNETYNIPKDLEEITEDVYKELTVRNDLNHITWSDSAIVEEPEEEREAREILQAERVAEGKRNEFKEWLLKNQEYLKLNTILTQAGRNILEDE